MKPTSPAFRKYRSEANEFSFLLRNVKMLEKELYDILDKWEGNLPDDAKAQVNAIKVKLAELRPRLQELRVKLFY